MARYEQSYTGARRTSKLTIQLTCGEHALLKDAAREAGAASLSAHVRALCLRRLADSELVARTRRNPDARYLTYQLSALGNNLNQLARIANTTGQVRTIEDLEATTALLRLAIARVIEL